MLKAMRRLESSSQSRELARRLGFTIASDLSKARLRALWASKFITLIRGDDDQGNSKILTTSLQDELRNCSLDRSHFKEFDLNEENSIEQEMKAMFTTGIQLNELVFTQERFLDARLNARIEEESNKPFVFVPTVLVTRPIFYMIKRLGKNATMYFGNFGTGKSTAFMIYVILTNFINKCLHLTLDSGKPQDMQLLSSLYKSRQIVRSPKAFYASIPMAVQFQDGLKQIVIDQMDEFNEKQKKQLNNTSFHKVMGEIKKKYKGRLRYAPLKLLIGGTSDTLIIVDQINALAAKYRQYNQQIQKINSNILLSKEKRQALIQKANQKFQYYRQVREVVYQYACNLGPGSRTIFNSSINIELYLMKKGNNYEGMNLDNSHAPLIEKKLNYGSNLIQPWGQKSFKDYFWEEMALRLFDPVNGQLRTSAKDIDLLNQYATLQEKSSKQEQTIKQKSHYKQLFDEEMKNYTIPPFWRLLFIRLAFEHLAESSNWTVYDTFLTNPTSSTFRLFLEEVKIQIFKSGKRQFNTRYNKALIKGSALDINDRADLYLMIGQHLAQIRKSQSDKEIFEISAIQNPVLYAKFMLHLSKNIIDGEMLYFQQSEADSKHKKIIFFYTIDEFSAIYRTILNATFKKIMQRGEKILSEFLAAKIQRYAGLIGDLLEDCLIECIYKASSKHEMKSYKLEKKTIPNPQIEQIQISELAIMGSTLSKITQEEKKGKTSEQIFKTLKEKIRITGKFQPNHTKLIKQLKSTEKVMALILMNRGQQFAITANQEAGGRLINSAIVDYVLLKYKKEGQNSGVFLVQTYDVTVGSYQFIRDKIMSAYQPLVAYKQLLNQLLTNINDVVASGQVSSAAQDKVKIIHTIVCKNQMAQKIKTTATAAEKDNKFTHSLSNGNYEVKVAAIQDIKIKSTKAKDDLQLYNELLQALENAPANEQSLSL